jgi:aminoglycoside 2''-phosphotransferase
MADLFAKPSPDDVLRAVQQCFPSLSATHTAFLSEGWDSWAYESAGCIFRVPKHDYTLGSQKKERALMPRLARMLPLAVPDMEFACDRGPNGNPFVGYAKIAGVPLSTLPLFDAGRLGAPLGCFLKALHSAPIGDFREIFEAEEGRKDYGVEAQERIGGFYERVVRQAFPLISCEARDATRDLFEPFLSNPANFDYEQCIVHGDLGAEHILVDSVTGDITGVIDFGDAWLGDPAGDFATILAGRTGEYLGTEGIAAAVEAYGGDASTQVYHDIIAGIDLRDEDILEEALRTIAEVTKGRKPCP